MRHNREEVIERVVHEYELLDQLVVNLKKADWDRFLLRPEDEDPWTVKDALAHITHWKADIARRIKRLPIPPEERGLEFHEQNRLIYLRWHDRSPREVLAWHRQVQVEILTALEDAPEAWFSGKEHAAEWPYDLDGHSAFHRIRDIQRALSNASKG